jgi:hypothetical protein
MRLSLTGLADTTKRSGVARARASSWALRYPGAVRRWSCSALVLAWPLFGCVIELPPEAVPEPCEVTVCSSDATCHGGTCSCVPGYAGNAYAVHGCQPQSPGTSCADGCGPHAYCEDDACHCESGYLAVCEEGGCLAVSYLCDGVDDCAAADDEQPSVCIDQAIQEWEVVDACDDGVDTRWRVWALGRDWVWPSIDATFSTWGLDVVSVEAVECIDGELLCFGASEGDLHWGVGLDGTRECEGCCVTCADDVVEMPVLRCD